MNGIQLISTESKISLMSMEVSDTTGFSMMTWPKSSIQSVIYLSEDDGITIHTTDGKEWNFSATKVAGDILVINGVDNDIPISNEDLYEKIINLL